MSQERYFHFTIGPVQDFVAQARRTRDFWAGSFLLSWLSGVAMQSTLKQQGSEILFPHADKAFMSWLTGECNGKKPRQGSIPNRFKAKIKEGFNHQQVVDSVNIAWRSIADLVFENDFELLGLGDEQLNKTRDIWERQTNDFWEINWAISGDETDSGILDRRKNWRRVSRLNEEPAVKCMMMAGYQELSGVDRPNKKAQKDFWKAVRASGKTAIQSDLYEGESLCAIAFVKRRFVHYFEALHIAKMPGKHWSLHGWKVDKNVPSVSYMAAVHWLEAVMKAAKLDKQTDISLQAFNEKAYQLTKDRGGWNNEIHCIEALIDSKETKRQASHDGNVFFQTVLENENLYPDQKEARKVVKALQALNQTATVSAVSPFYAVLMMDGDNLGSNLSSGVPQIQKNIAESLATFTHEATNIVERNNGFLIYAGGDDVLAILPLEDAMSCAKTLHDEYAKCFNGTGVKTTLSGAIEYAHIKMPLTKVLQDAHDLLDNIAKEQTGRDALAIRVWKPGGKAVQWAQPWQHLAPNDSIILQELVDTFSEKTVDDTSLTNQFFFKISDYFEVIEPKNADIDTYKDQLKSLLAMEYINTLQNRKVTMEKAEVKVKDLLEQCLPHYRDEEGERQLLNLKSKGSRTMMTDATLLIRFLAQKGVE
jgi:CRISPR-associated protein Cmr2